MYLAVEGYALRKRVKCREKFLKVFTNGFYDEKYLNWERDYKWKAHLHFKNLLNEDAFKELLFKSDFNEIAQRALSIESSMNYLSSLEKIALRDSLRTLKGAKLFSNSLFNFIYGTEEEEIRFGNFAYMLSVLPRKQIKIETWPVATVFGFIAEPMKYIFLKPKVMQAAATAYSYNFKYRATIGWETYKSLIDFTNQIKTDHPDLHPRDFIDLESFLTVLGSTDYDHTP